LRPRRRAAYSTIRSAFIRCLQSRDQPLNCLGETSAQERSALLSRYYGPSREYSSIWMRTPCKLDDLQIITAKPSNTRTLLYCSDSVFAALALAASDEK
jgi:hypothetical protein